MRATLLLMLPLLLAAEPKRIVIVAADPGQSRAVRLLKYSLETSANLRGVACEVHPAGWPADAGAWEKADSIVLVSSASVLNPDRIKQLEVPMTRGAGLVLLHRASETNDRQVVKSLAEWCGGHANGAPSNAMMLTPLAFADATHPTAAGGQPFAMKIQPPVPLTLVATPKPSVLIRSGRNQPVAWSTQRANGGRSVCCSITASFDAWYEPSFRRFILNSIVWTAKGDIPTGGVDSATLDEAMYDQPDPSIADWTPRPATGKAEPWERKRDPEWDDDRFRQMDTGPTFAATFAYPYQGKNELVYKGLSIKVPGGGALFDRASGNWAATWTGGYLNHSNRRFALLNTPTPNAKTLQPRPPFRMTIPSGPNKYVGFRRHGEQVVVLTKSGSEIKATTVKAEGGMPQLETVAPDSPLMKAGPKLWGEPIVTPLAVGPADGPFRTDTLTIPYQNKFNALFFCTSVTGHQGRIAITTCHGDVWLVNVDEAKKECHWQRFATGLYHPFGIQSIDGKLVVLERGQLTRLHDENNDGEADFYENLCNNWHTGAGEHSYDTGLETDRDGNFYFFKTGDTNLPSGGTLLKVSPDGAKVEIFATGFRHPIGLGMSDSGIVTGADQEGNWMPATRVDQYKPGGFYGDMRAHHRSVAPKIYDGPLCWLPREVDNSAGGQVWLPGEAKGWGPLAGLPLHLSYGRCKAFVLLRQELADGRVQGGVCDLGLRFLSGSCRGVFSKTGKLYVVGLNGWQTAAQQDGSLQRVVPTGKPIDVVVNSTVTKTGVRLTFSRPIDPKSITPASFNVAAWNYRWSADYGSKRWKPSNPNAEGMDTWTVTATKLIGEKTVELTFAKPVSPVMQLQIGYSVTATDAKPVAGSVYLTVHGTE